MNGQPDSLQTINEAVWEAHTTVKATIDWLRSESVRLSFEQAKYRFATALADLDAVRDLLSEYLVEQGVTVQTAGHLYRDLVADTCLLTLGLWSAWRHFLEFQASSANRLRWRWHY